MLSEMCIARTKLIVKKAMVFGHIIHPGTYDTPGHHKSPLAKNLYHNLAPQPS